MNHSNPLSLYFGAVVILLVGIVMTAQAEVIETFRNGVSNSYVSDYSGTQDTMLAASAPTYNCGGATTVAAWAAQGRSIILRFDGLTAIPAADLDRLTKVTLLLTEVESSLQTANFEFSVYQVADANAGWNEGNKNYAAASAGEATYSYKSYNTIGWAGSAGLGTAGTDYIATSLATGTYTNGDLAIIGDKTGTVIRLEIPVSLIKTWATGGTNAGLLIRGTGNNSANFATSEYNNSVAYRPGLELTFSEVPEPATSSLLTLAGIGLALLKKKL